MSDERRIVTILFADVAESTALGEALDPDDMRALLARYTRSRAKSSRRTAATSARGHSTCSQFSNGTKWKLQGEWSSAAFTAGTGYPNLRASKVASTGTERMWAPRCA